MSQEEKLRLFKNTKAWKELPHELLEEMATVMTVEEVRFLFYSFHFYVISGNPFIDLSGGSLSMHACSTAGR